ncbi:carboxypeptidase-like regulatory domain-containing protein [uncultured Maribacter sp.]|uniref:carboxypeptidase-like regulatory domain-containing protein n=1 Tax=uncultured Maribacter sp. TaxID=431308 RepID=UPI00262079B1|nr:carboxypeptidase-like regulatory domain-containing protein [uncultured Maribacter sp.]
MKNIFLACLLLVSTHIFSQDNGSVKGKIVDVTMNNEPLLYANVALKDSERKVQTNFHGNFEINNLTAGEHIIVVSYPGYETIEVPVVVVNNTITKVDKGLSAIALNLEDLYIANKEQTTIAFENISAKKEGTK